MRNKLKAFLEPKRVQRAEEERSLSNTVWERALRRLPLIKRQEFEREGFGAFKRKEELDYIKEAGTKGQAELYELLVFELITFALDVLHNTRPRRISSEAVIQFLNAGRYHISASFVRQRLMRKDNSSDVLSRAYGFVRKEYGVGDDPSQGREAGVRKQLPAERERLLSDLLHLNRFLSDKELVRLTRFSITLVRKVRSELAKDGKIPSEAYPAQEAARHDLAGSLSRARSQEDYATKQKK